jgi:hypothetical protein
MYFVAFITVRPERSLQPHPRHCLGCYEYEAALQIQDKIAMAGEALPPPPFSWVLRFQLGRSSSLATKCSIARNDMESQCAPGCSRPRAPQSTARGGRGDEQNPFEVRPWLQCTRTLQSAFLCQCSHFWQDLEHAKRLWHDIVLKQC